MTATDVVIIGAGPLGLELAANLKAAGTDYLHLDAGTVGQTVTWYPRQVRFFSSPERIAICGVPLPTADQSKATREEYLAYLRGIVEQFDLAIRTHERVTGIEKRGDAFHLTTRTHAGDRTYEAQRVVLAIGDMHRPRKISVPGEDLPHVSHYFFEPHEYFRQRLLVVGGRNSAVEAALRCHRAGAQVTLSHRRTAFEEKVIKYWLLPEIQWLIEKGEIGYRPCSEVTRITPTHVHLRRLDDGQALDPVEADFVLLMTGYEMDTSLFEMAGAELAGPNQRPRIDHETMETSVPGLYVAGTAAAGTQARFHLFIENCHPHVVKLCRALTGRDPTHVNRLGFERLHEDPFTKHDKAVET